MSGSLTHGGEENVPGIPGACATHNFTYLVRGPTACGNIRVKQTCARLQLSITKHKLCEWILGRSLIHFWKVVLIVYFRASDCRIKPSVCRIVCCYWDIARQLGLRTCWYQYNWFIADSLAHGKSRLCDWNVNDVQPIHFTTDRSKVARILLLGERVVKNDGVLYYMNQSQ